MFRPRCLPILIGSLPVQTHRAAMDLILAATPEVPLWPQLPKMNPKEGMVRQFLSGFPGLVDEGKRFWIDSTVDDFSEEMTRFYEDYLTTADSAIFSANSRFSLGEDSAAGFKVFCDTLSHHPNTTTVKGQVTGPITTGIGTRDRHGNAILFDDNLRDMLIKHLSMKAAWQVGQLSRFTSKVPPILFIDEPGLVSFGSSGFSGVTNEMVISAVGEVIEAIQQAGGLAGVHICANGDWGPALASNADILSFDAYSYFANLMLYRAELIGYLKRGGILAWGIVPTGDPDQVAKESVESLFSKWLEQLDELTGLGFSKQQLKEQTFIAPACGTGSLSEELACKVLTMTRELAQKCRNDH